MLQNSPVCARFRRLAVALLLLAGVGLTLTAEAHASVGVGLSQQSFATGDSTSRVRVQAGVESEFFRAQLRAFQESGRLGDSSIEIPEVYLHRRLSDGDSSLQWEGWLGRRLPFESRFSVWNDARASLWVRNESEPFDPLLVGWMGAGGSLRLTNGSRVSVAWSPFFLPNFGPRLSLSSDSPAVGSRYGRLPPAQVRVGEALLPLRYQVEAGPLSQIVLQQQAYLEWSKGAFSVFSWSAPRPDPVVDPAAVLRVSASSADALVTVRPSFPRQSFTGAAFRLENFEAQIAAELVASRLVSSVASSMAWRPFQAWSLGVLRHEAMSWSLGWKPMTGLTQPWLEWRQTPGREASLRGGVDHGLSRSLRVFSRFQILSATDRSPWASWRGFDYLEAGLGARW